LSSFFIICFAFFSLKQQQYHEQDVELEGNHEILLDTIESS